MTRLALREKEAGLRIDACDEPDRKDFMSFYGVRDFFLATVIYAVVFLLAASFIFSAVTIQVNRLNISLTVFIGILGYLFFLLLYLSVSRKTTIRRFEKYRSIMKEQQADLAVLREIYEKEEIESHGSRDGADEDRSGDEESNQ